MRLSCNYLVYSSPFSFVISLRAWLVFGFARLGLETLALFVLTKRPICISRLVTYIQTLSVSSW